MATRFIRSECKQRIVELISANTDADVTATGASGRLTFHTANAGALAEPT